MCVYAALHALLDKLLQVLRAHAEDNHRHVSVYSTSTIIPVIIHRPRAVIIFVAVVIRSHYYHHRDVSRREHVYVSGVNPGTDTVDNRAFREAASEAWSLEAATTLACLICCFRFVSSC